MLSILRGRRSLGWLVAAAIAFQALPAGSARAGMLATDTIIATEQVDQRSLVRAYLAREEVRNALLRHGVNSDEAIARVDVMSDVEVAMVAGTIEDEPAGQGLGIVVAAALIALIVLIVADLSGKKDIF